MLQCELVTFKEFMANRIAEVKKNSNVCEWFWVPTEEKLADMGTRPHVVAEDLGLNSFYQGGRPRMLESEAKWLTRKTFKEPPTVERNPCLVTVATATVEMRAGKYGFEISQFLDWFSFLQKGT